MGAIGGAHFAKYICKEKGLHILVGVHSLTPTSIQQKSSFFGRKSPNPHIISCINMRFMHDYRSNYVS